MEIETTQGGVPSGNVVASAVVPEATVEPVGLPFWIAVPLPTPAPSTAGSQYAIVISAAAASCGSDCFYWGTALGDVYAAGAALTSLDVGSTWFPPAAGFDRAFQTYVTPAPTSIDQCRQDGWRNFAGFKNQGDCVSFVVTHR